MAGFGGVAEYGITVRWDKNFLKIIRLLLERRAQFAMYGGVRFGGTLTIDSAFDLGFDHIALCAGAGRPTVIPMKNGLAPGVRQASDFLMALATDRRGQDRQHRQSDRAPAGRRDRRRADRDRHRDRGAGLLRGAGREVPHALRDPGRRARRRGRARPVEQHRARHRRGVHHPRPRACAPSARPPPARAARRVSRS